MSQIFAYLRVSCRYALALCAALSILVPVHATAGTPSYIGPYSYSGYFYNGPTPPGYWGYATEAEAAQAGVAAAAQNNGTNFCNYRMGSIPTRDWYTSGPYVVYIEGVETRNEHQSYYIYYSSNMGTWCAGNTISSAWVVVRSRIVCSSTQRFFDGKCVNVSPLTIAGQKGSNLGPTCPAKGGHSCGEPINTANGNMWHVETDFQDRNGGDLTLQRTYNSALGNSTETNIFGASWRTPYDMSIRTVVDAATNGAMKCYTRRDNDTKFCESNWVPNTVLTTASSLDVTRGDGKSYRFSLAGGVYKGAADTDDKLISIYGADNSIVGFRYEDASKRTVEQYDTKGSLLSITSSVGSKRRLTYSDGTTNNTSVGRYPFDAPICNYVQSGEVQPAGRLLCVTDDWGRQVHFEYDVKGRVTLMRDPAGQSYAYEYDGNGGGCDPSSPTSGACSANNLTKVTYADGASRRYFYNELTFINNGGDCSRWGKALGNGYGHLLNAMTGLIDENGGRYITWNYACFGFASGSKLANGVNRIDVTVNTTTDFQTSSAQVVNYVGDPAAPTTLSSSFVPTLVLGTYKNLSVSTPCAVCGPIKSRTYDANGNVATMTDWNGSVTKYTYDLTRNLQTSRTEASGTTSARTITTVWHAGLRLPTIIAEPKLITTYVYDAAGNVLSRTEQATSDTTGASGTSAATVGTARTWTYTYNEHGQPTTVVGPRTDIVDKTTYDYDAKGNLALVTNALGHVSSYSNYDDNGHVGRIVEPSGLFTEFTYTSRGKVASRTVSDGTSRETTSFEYDLAGQLIRQTNPDGSWMTLGYDQAHRLTSVNDNLGNNITYTLDLTGNRVAEQVKDPTGALVRQVARVFNTLGQLTKVTGAAQ